MIAVPSTAFSGHDDVELAARDVVALDVPREVEGAVAQDAVRLHDLLRPLLRLLPYRQQPDARAADAVHGLHVGGTHARELDEPLGALVDVGAAVEDEDRAAGNR